MSPQNRDTKPLILAPECSLRAALACSARWSSSAGSFSDTALRPYDCHYQCNCDSDRDLANRWKATSQPDCPRETSSTIANVTPPNRSALRSARNAAQNSPNTKMLAPKTNMSGLKYVATRPPIAAPSAVPMKRCQETASVEPSDDWVNHQDSDWRPVTLGKMAQSRCQYRNHSSQCSTEGVLQHLTTRQSNPFGWLCQL
jgi:hypothetical protein